MTTRLERLMPSGTPRYIRCYDNGGESVDRYTVVFTGRYKGREGCDYLCMSGMPFHPQGVGMHGWNPNPIDQPSYKHLGKKIQFADLPEDCQTFVLNNYKATWELTANSQ